MKRALGVHGWLFLNVLLVCTSIICSDIIMCSDCNVSGHGVGWRGYESHAVLRGSHSTADVVALCDSGDN